jgi:hypothetical protein
MESSTTPTRPSARCLTRNPEAKGFSANVLTYLQIDLDSHAAIHQHHGLDRNLSDGSYAGYVRLYLPEIVILRMRSACVDGD